MVAGDRPRRSAICAIDRPSTSRKWHARATARRRSVTRSGAELAAVDAIPRSYSARLVSLSRSSLRGLTDSSSVGAEAQARERPDSAAARPVQCDPGRGTSVFPQLVFDPVKEQLRDRWAATAALVCQDRVSSTGLPCFRRGGGSAARPICGRRARADALRRPYRIRASTDLRWRTDSPRECELSKDGSTATRHTRMRRDCPSTKGAGGGGSAYET
jgi:hypothetical protein